MNRKNTILFLALFFMILIVIGIIIIHTESKNKQVDTKYNYVDKCL